MTAALLCALLLGPTAEELNHQGTVLSQKKDFAGALALYQKAIVKDPKNELYISNAAAASWWLGKHDAAIELYNRAADLAAVAKAFDRVAQYHGQMMQVRYVMPPGANEKRNAAAALPDTPEAKAALPRWQAAYQRTVQLIQLGQAAEGKAIANEAVTLSRSAFGDAHINTLASLNNLGDVLRRAGEPEAAAKAYQEALRGAKKSLGAGHPDAFVYMNNLASAWQQAGKLAMAKEIFEKLVRLSTKSLGSAHPITATYLLNAGLLYAELGEHKRAAQLVERALQSKRKAFGPNHQDTLTTARAFGDVLARRGDQSSAIATFEDAHERSRRLLSAQHPLTLQLSEDLLGALERAGRFVEMIRLLEQDVGDATAAAGEKAGPTWAAKNRLAQQLELTGGQKRARDLYAEVVAGMTAAEDVDADAFDTLRNNLAMAEMHLGNFDAAERLFAEVVARSTERHGADHPETLGYLNNQALLMGELGRYGTAGRIYEKVLRVRQRTLPRDDPERIRSRFNLGMHYMKIGRLLLAERMVSLAAKGRERVFGAEHPETLMALNGLALVRYEQGDYAAAQPLMERVYAARRKVLGPNHRDTLISMTNLAVLYRHQLRFKRSVDLLHTVLAARQKTLGHHHPHTVNTINQLGLILEESYQPKRAEEFFAEALRRSEKSLGKDHPVSIMLLNNVAQSVSSQEKYQKALVMSREVYERATRTMGEEHPESLIYLGNIAAIQDKLGQDADALYTKVWQRKAKAFGEMHPETLVTLNNLAYHHQTRGNLERADEYLAKSFRTANEFLDRVLWGADATTRQTYLFNQVFFDQNYLTYWLGRGGERGAREVWTYATTRKGMLLNLAAQVNAIQRTSGKDRDKARELADLRRELARMILEGKSDARSVARRESLQREVDSVEAELGRRVSALRRQSVPEPKDILRALPAGAVLVDFVLFDFIDQKALESTGVHIAAVAASKGGITAVDLGRGSPVFKDIRQLKQELGRRGNQDRADTLGRSLYAKLLAPLGDRVLDADTLYIVPDGPLHLIPFGALVGPEGKYLVETHALRVLTSSRDLVRRRSKTRPGPPVIVAAPEFGDTESKSPVGVSFGALPGTAAEGNEVLALLQQKSQLLSGAGATEAALARVHRPRILHLATHGFFLPPRAPPQAGASEGTRGVVLGKMSERKPKKGKDDAVDVSAVASQDALIRSGLALAGANGDTSDDGEDGILTAMEVLSLDLTGTELVVLSACETGLGQVTVGEGVFGLRRAFQEAGAASVVSSLWSVDDEGTRRLMQRFYKHVLAGQPPATALRSAQREFLADPKWKDPYYWAAFTSVGTR